MARWPKIVAPIRLVLPSVVAVAVGWLSPSAWAWEKVSFSLSNTGTTAVSEALFKTMPPGTVVPSISGTDEEGNPIEGPPLNALSSSTGVGIDQTFVLLGSQDLPDGSTQDSMFLIFGYKPNPSYDPSDPNSLPFIAALDDSGNPMGQLQPGGRFDFELNLANPADAGLIVPTSADLHLGPLAYARDGGTTPGEEAWSGLPGEVTTIPEPGALVLWMGMAGAGVLMARRRMRAGSVRTA